MGNVVKPPRLVLWLTIGILIVIGGIVIYIYEAQASTASFLDIKGQPTIGFPKATVQVVAFEEPKCINCAKFNHKVYPKIKKEFIDTHKITYTVIPVSFLPRSMPAAIALLCVYHANPQQSNGQFFFAYLHYLFDHQPDEHTHWATAEKLSQFAKEASIDIPIDKLKTCIDQKIYQKQIEQNTAYGRKVMGGAIATPTIYVNGVEVEDLSFEEISNSINEALEQKRES